MWNDRPDKDREGRDFIDVRPRGGGGSRRWRLVVVGLLLLALFGITTASSWYVEALWFGSLGFSSVFWTSLALRGGLFVGFFLATVVLLLGAFRLLRPAPLETRLLTRTIFINDRPVTFSLARVFRIAGWLLAIIVGLGAGLGMAAEWDTFALYWAAPPPAALSDPVFGRPVTFYLFTLPAWDLLATWLTTLAIIALLASVVYFVLMTGQRAFDAFRGVRGQQGNYGGVSLAFGLLLGVWAWRVYLSRFDRLFEDRAIFSGVNYTDAHIVIPGLGIVAIALAAGALLAIVNAVRPRRLTWIGLAIVPAVVIYIGVSLVSWYVSGFIVKPNELVRETPYITHNITYTRYAFGLNRVQERQFPAETSVQALDLKDNQTTIDNVRLWDWRALRDTLRQVQAIRTYYDFPDIDIDRYTIGGQERQVMVAAREMNLQHLPESSRNWINERLIYTHGYGVTINPVNGFTPEGMPDFLLANTPVQSTTPDLKVTRPEIYFGEMTTSDVYVRTRQREFNFPQGESNSYTTYEGKGGIEIGSSFRRLIIALARGDLTKLPFSDDITADSRLLMRREIRERVSTIAPFLTYDPDPYIVVAADGRLYWLMDGFTMSSTYPYATHYRLDDQTSVNYLRNSVKVLVDTYDGTVTFYVFDQEDPIIAGYRKIFPALFRPASDMPAAVRAHVRYPELLLQQQAAVYSLYHMADPQVFYNREDLWTVASQVVVGENREQSTQPIEPNFVLMRLPGESNLEFVEILPFTPSKRNNLVGWIAGRSDGAAYGSVRVYDFPKSRLVDGPLQIEARIDQNPQVSSQLTLWNQMGSRVRRGSLLVIPMGRAIFYVQTIYLQAEHSPMPELRMVVTALQDRLGFGPTFNAAMQMLLSESAAAGAEQPAPGEQPKPQPATAGAQPPAGPPNIQALIDQAARDLQDYQRLTAEGKLGEAGQKLDDLRKVLEQLRKK